MLRLVFQLLGLLALLLAPLPAAAASPQPAPAASAAAEHCSETGAAAGHQDEDRSQEEAQHPCCKSSMNCCPVAAALAGPLIPRLAEAVSPAHRRVANAFVPGSANPPLTEPPTLA